MRCARAPADRPATGRTIVGGRRIGAPADSARCCRDGRRRRRGATVGAMAKHHRASSPITPRSRRAGWSPYAGVVLAMPAAMLGRRFQARRVTSTKACVDSRNGPALQVWRVTRRRGRLAVMAVEAAADAVLTEVGAAASDGSIAFRSARGNSAAAQPGPTAAPLRGCHSCRGHRRSLLCAAVRRTAAVGQGRRCRTLGGLGD